MKRITVILLFSIISMAAAAQSFPLNVGIRGGWNDTKIKVKEMKIESHGGYMFGAFARLNLGKLYIERPTVDGNNLTDMHVGDKFKVSTQVYLAGLRPDEVEVEAYYGTVNVHNEIIESGAEKMDMVEELPDNNYRFSCEIVCQAAGRFGLTARIKAAGHDWDNSVPGFMCWPR